MEKTTYHESVEEAIIQALLILLKHKPYEEISVSEIVRKAGVGRSSFYRNFIDKDDVLERYVTKLFSRSQTLRDPYGKHLKETIIEHYTAYYENRDFLMTLYKNNILYRFMGNFRSITEKNIEDNNMTVNQYQASFFSAASLGVLAQWLERGSKETPAEIADIFVILLFHTPGRDYTA